MTSTASVDDGHFQSHPVLSGVHVNVRESPVGPVEIFGWDSSRSVTVPLGGSAIALATGVSTFAYRRVSAMVPGGSYALLPGGALVNGVGGLIIYTPEYEGLPCIGGPVESFGRLKYIDGCSDSLVISPDLYGKPCLNHLHIPAGINQTAHVHPSDRIGIILRGAGECRTPNGRYALQPGMFWRIPQGGVHSFHTDGDSLDVLAWHPDSEIGPKHDDHPMLSRTIIDGTSAKEEQHRAIRTTEIRA